MTGDGTLGASHGIPVTLAQMMAPAQGRPSAEAKRYLESGEFYADHGRRGGWSTSDRKKAASRANAAKARAAAQRNRLSQQHPRQLVVGSSER